MKTLNTIRRECLLLLFAAAFLARPSTAAAQSNIDPVNKWSWSENGGWFNWYDNGVTSGARVSNTFLSGFIWSEEFGWIFLGDGTPGGGTAYTNSIAADTGVNIAPNGDLYGYAWAENFGWINFGTAPLAGADRARVQWCCPSARLRGFAWGENIGWINLETALGYVGLGPGAARARGDVNGDGLRNGLDLQRFVRVFLDPPLAGAADFCASDMNADGVIDNNDVALLVTCLLTGVCPCP